MKNSEDEAWMMKALAEGRRGLGLTAPNPPVGAIIVKDGIELSRGWHQKAGTAHAERDALKKTNHARGATIYVTLEPCSTVGRTGSCCSALIEAGITRVVYGACDPNPAHRGRAKEILENAEIQVDRGICRKACEELIRPFAKVQTCGLPWVIAKTAMSLDGRITRPPEESQWLTSEKAREEVQLLRAEVDAILTSGETIRRDDPALTLRSKAIPKEKLQPLRVVITRTGLAHSRYQIFQDGQPTRIFHDVPLREILKDLVQEEGVTSLLLECGGELMGAFLDEGLIDEFVIYLAPIVTGGPSPALGGSGAETLQERLHLLDPVIRKIGPDLVARAIMSDTTRPLVR